MSEIIEHNVPNFDWEVESQKVVTENGLEIDGFKALVRSDTQEPFIVHKNSYNVFTNKAFSMTLRAIQEASDGRFEFDRYHVHKGGKKVVGYLKNTGDGLNICGFPVGNYLSLHNSHDGTSKVVLGHVNKLYRCANMFASIVPMWSFKHTKNMDEGIRHATRAIGLYVKKEQYIKEILERSWEVKIDRPIIDNMIDAVLNIDRPNMGSSEDLSTNMVNLIENLESCIYREINDIGEKNLFSLFNGITYYTSNHDHGGKTAAHNREAMNLFGDGMTKNTRAFEFTERLVAAN